MPEEMRRPSAAEVEHTSAAKAQVEADLFAIPGVHAVGIGYKRVGGKLTDEVRYCARASGWGVPWQPSERLFLTSGGSGIAIASCAAPGIARCPPKRSRPPSPSPGAFCSPCRARRYFYGK